MSHGWATCYVDSLSHLVSLNAVLAGVSRVVIQRNKLTILS